MLVDADRGNGRSLGEPRHNDRDRIRAPRIFNQDALEPAAARSAAGSGHDQVPVIEPRRGLVLISGAPAGIHVRHHERDATGPERAINESQGGRISAPGAIDAADLIASNGELVGVRLAFTGPPAAAIVVGILSGGCVADCARRQEEC